MKLDYAYDVLEDIRKNISRLTDNMGYLPDEFEFDYDDVEEKYKSSIALQAVDSLRDVQYLLEWVNKPVIAEGHLVKGSDGRYELPQADIYFTSGAPLDVWDEDDERWYKSRVEHNGKDYYIVALGREKNISNVLVRIRR